MIEVRLQVEGGVADVVVDADDRSTVAEVAASVARAVGAHGSAPTLAVVRPVPTRLDPDALFEESGIRRGDVVALDGGSAAAPVAPKASVVELVVVAGPAKGRRFDLAPGSSLVGRDPSCDVALTEDAAISKRHASIQCSELVLIEDAGSTNGIEVNDRIIRGRTVLNPGDRVSIGNTQLLVARATPARMTKPMVPFNRPPRIWHPFVPPSLKFPNPPETPAPFEFPTFTVLASLVMGGLFFLVSGSIQTVAFVAFSPILLLAGLFESTRSGKINFAKATKRWRELVGRALASLEAYTAEELRSSRASNPPVASLLALPPALATQVWERRPDDSDFLDLRIGVNDRATAVLLELPDHGDPELQAELDDAVAARRTISDAPVTVDLRRVGSLAVLGDPRPVADTVRAVLSQVVVLHSPIDLGLAVAISRDDEPDWGWTKWLPHVSTARTVLGGRSLGTAEGALGVLDGVRRLISERLEGRVGARTESALTDGEAIGSGSVASPSGDEPELVVVLHANLLADPILVNDLLERGPAVGVYFLWVGHSYPEAPSEAGSVVTVDPDGSSAELAVVRSGARVALRPDRAAVGELAGMVAVMASLVDVGGRVDDAASIPARVNLADVNHDHDIFTDPEAVARRWSETDVSEKPGLRGFVGRGSDSPFSLCLREDGPHALVAGTTGSGKSEFLQSWVTSLAIANSPRRVNFLLVDYKGGSAFKDCRRLPHTVGMVTDLDTSEVRRVIVSLEAELRRREEILHAANAKDLMDMERKRDPETPPSLVIVVDEFSALAKEVPEFVEGMVNIAQRGRSLGLHLILATQRPAGVVTDNIRANTNLRIALRVSDREDSTDVLNSPMAAEFPRSIPGRAAVRIGAAELVQFQSAYVGGFTDATSKEIRIGSFGFDGSTFAASPETAGSERDPDVTDLTRLVTVTRRAKRDLGLPDPYRPWLAPLSPAIALEELPRISEAHKLCIGLIDVPERQQQEAAYLNLEKVGSVLVYGASRSGKTVLLRTIAAALSRRDTRDPVQVYAIDGGRRGLDPIQGLPVVGSVLQMEDRERVRRLFRVLIATIERRSGLFAETGAASLLEYNARLGSQSLEARIFVLLDGLASFVANYEDIERGYITDMLLRIVAEGRAAGVHLIMTSDQISVGLHQLSNLVQQKIVLRMAQPDAYSSLDVIGPALPDTAPPGRAYLGSDLVMQVAILGGSTVGEDQVRAFEQLAGGQAGKVRTPEVPRLPVRIEPGALPVADERGRVVLGIRESDLAAASVDLAVDHFFVVGTAQSGKSTTLATLARKMVALDPTIELLRCVPRLGPTVDEWAGVPTVAGSSQTAARLGEIAEWYAAGTAPSSRRLIVVDDIVDFFDDDCDEQLAALLRHSLEHPITVLVAAEAARMKGAYLDSLSRLRSARSGLLLQPDADRDGDWFDIVLPRSSAVDFPTGRGYQVTANGMAEIVQVELTDLGAPG